MIYNIVIYFVLLGIAIASLFNEKVRKMWRGEREAFKILKQKVDPNAKYIWFHGASLGEFEQGRPLMSVFVRIILSIRFCSPSILLWVMRCARTMRVPTSSAICLWIPV